MLTEIITEDEPPQLRVSGSNLTTKWIDQTDYHQIVELWIENTDSQKFLTGAHDLQVVVQSDSVDTVSAGTVKRLAPGQRALVQVGIRNKAGNIGAASCTGTVVAKYGCESQQRETTQPLAGTCGIVEYDPTAASLEKHRTPDWFDKIKYGIFIHWGLYSVPAYGNTGKNENYAEWLVNKQFPDKVES